MTQRQLMAVCWACGFYQASVSQLKSKVFGTVMCRYRERLTGSDDVAQALLAEGQKKSPNQSHSQQRQ